jgi:cytochrome c-type biogenesis protein CcmF
VIAWRRVTVANLRRGFAKPVAAAAVVLAALLLLTPAAESTTSLVMFTLVAFVLAVVVQEFARGAAARRVMTREAWPVAVRSLVGRNRRRYGGYIVHAGIAVMFLGVAASSAFHEQRDARLLPGQSANVGGGYRVTYVKPTARLLDDRSGTGAPLTLGAEMRVTKDGRSWTMRPARNYYDTQGGSGTGPFSGLFDGESTSEVDLRWGATKDFWVAVQPDLRSIQKAIRDADSKFATAKPELQLFILSQIVNRYVQKPVALPVRAIVSPLVAWIWIGGAVALLGAMLALWPAPAARRREVASAYSARLGSELTRA